MREYGRTLGMCKFYTNLTDQRPGYRLPEEVRPLISRLPLHGWKREVTADFLSYIHENRFFRATVTSFFKRRLSVFARLPQINVDTDYFVPLLNQPAKNYGGIKPT
jgi:hypothetical protein